MILPAALALGAQLMMPVVADGVPQLNVEQVCEGIAKQGGVTFHDPAIAQEKKNCLESEQAIRDELVKQWSSFTAADKTSCANESKMGGESSYTELLGAWKWRAMSELCAMISRVRRAGQNRRDSGSKIDRFLIAQIESRDPPPLTEKHDNGSDEVKSPW